MNIYVGNLPYTITEDELRSAFERYGAVTSAKIVMDRETGRSKGFGFVEMPEQDEAEAAVKALDGAPLNGRPARVNPAKPRTPGGGGGGGGGYGGPRRPNGGGGGGMRPR
jgi:RNA recognition motif-containing protein